MKEEERNPAETPSSILESFAPAISKYLDQLGAYLSSTNARFDLYRYDIKRLENGISIDVAFKVTVQTEKKQKHE